MGQPGSPPSRGRSDEPEAAVGPTGPHWIWLFAILALAAAARWHRLGVPLERDEGEYAYIGQLLLQGTPPFEAAHNMKLPGIYVVYALVMGAFGETIRGIHLGLLVVNLASIVLVHQLGRRLVDGFAGLAAAAVFAVLSIDPSVAGLWANSEHFVVLPMLGGLLALLSAQERGGAWRFALAGLLMGVAFTIKQHGIAFVVTGAVLLCARELRERPVDRRRSLARAAWYAAGAALPFAAVCTWMLAAGVFEKFWFWTFTYAAQYVSQVDWPTGREQLAAQLSAMGGPLIGAWILAALGVTALAWDRAARGGWIWIATFAAGSAAAVCPGLLFRDHYFLLVLPAAALLAGTGASALVRAVQRSAAPLLGTALGLLVLAAALGTVVAARWDELARLTDAEAARAHYGLNPFPESLEIAEYLRRESAPTDRIAVIGSEPQLYFYSGRRAATSYVYTYALMEEHPFALRMQEEMIEQIEQARPKLLVFVHVATSWLEREHSPPDLFRWVDRWVPSHYDQVGLVELSSRGTSFHWDAAARGRPLPEKSVPWVGVYRLKPG